MTVQHTMPPADKPCLGNAVAAQHANGNPKHAVPVPRVIPPKRSLPAALNSIPLPVASSPKKPRVLDRSSVPADPARRLARMSAAVKTLLECIGEDPSRDGLRDTPKRYAKALLSLTDGYAKTVDQVVGDATFDEDHHEPVFVRDITIHSLCEHHLLPFHGVAHVAYIPSGTVIGLSKVARIADLYARRLQVQERLSRQIADAVQHATGAAGVMVLVSSTHECMSMRGVQKVGAFTTTTATTGRYASEPQLRSEFLSIVGSPSSAKRF